jgi:hypothetical protein
MEVKEKARVAVCAHRGSLSCAAAASFVGEAVMG